METEDAVATLAVEMHMRVVVLAVVVVVGLAQLILHPTIAILQLVHQAVLAEDDEGAEDAALVDGDNALLQFRQRCGMLRCRQGLHHDDAVGRGLDAVALKQVYTC